MAAAAGRRGDFSERTVLVSDIPKHYDNENLEMFLESPARGGGGIERVEYNKDSATALVTFVDAQVARQLIQNGEMRRDQTRLRIARACVEHHAGSSGDNCDDKLSKALLKVEHLKSETEKAEAAAAALAAEEVQAMMEIERLLSDSSPGSDEQLDHVLQESDHLKPKREQAEKLAFELQRDLKRAMEQLNLMMLDDEVSATPQQQGNYTQQLATGSQPTKELNILLLGETGVGKSTWINGLINYLTYDTLAEAEKGKALCLIPTSFTMTDENYKERKISWGAGDMNERQHTGQSATQSPRTYVFRTTDITVRIIDTPGIGDTRGVKQDKENMQSIMSHLSHYDQLHGICILLKPNNARLGVMFTFCIKELLTNLHKDACKNMVICFTNARGTFYRPGDTLPSLQELLKNNPNVNIELSRETIYCMDNEAVRFLVAVKNGMKFDETERDNYEASWKKSVDESVRLIAHIAGLTPHLVKHTLSLNDARRSIIELSRPIGEITKTIQSNIELIRDKEKEQLSADMSKKDLAQKLFVPAIDLESISLQRPCTVCTATKCTRQVTFGNVTKIEYKERCHPDCQLTTDANLINCAELQKCWAMEPSGGKTCRSCGCSWNVHMHVTYETKQVTKNVIDDSVKKQIDDKESKIIAIKKHKRQLEAKRVQLEREKKIIVEVSAIFACFLKNNAIAPYNDAVQAYLNHIIDAEQSKVSLGGDRKTLQALQEMLRTYTEEIEAIEQAIQKNDPKYSKLKPADIKQHIKKLYSLEIAGPMLRDMMSIAEQCSDAAIGQCEKIVEIHQKSILRRAFSAVGRAFWK